jgi:hypothetical protein
MSEREDIQEAWLRNRGGVCSNCTKWKSLAGELMNAAELAMNAFDGLPFKRNFDARNALAKVMDKAREAGL